MAPRHHSVIIGGGSAGVSVAARPRRAGVEDLALVDPAVMHYCLQRYGPPALYWNVMLTGRA